MQSIQTVSYTHLGYITMAGRIPRAYWAKKMFGYELAAN